MIENPFKETIDELEHELAVRKARNNYLDYVALTNKAYVRSRFHTYLCNKIQEFIDTNTGHAFDILLLSVPPQHGKSLTVTQTLPAWYLGKHPERNIIIASYNEDFAVTFGRRNLQKLQEYPEVFPDAKLVASPCSNTEFETTKKGRCISRGIMSGITGNPANLIVIDDPIKNREEADSESTRAKQWNEYLSTIRTRIAPGGKLIVIQTRWHEDDLFGKLSREEKYVTIINLPCECDDPKHDPLGRKKGDALCPEIGRGNAWLKEFKQVYASKEGNRAWVSLYQGRPTQLEGNLFKRDWWQYYTELPALVYKVLSVDATFKEGEKNDFVAIEVWGKVNEDYYLVDLIKKRMGFVDTCEAIRSLYKTHTDTSYIYIEDKANGSAIIDVLSKEMTCPIVPVKPEGGKVARANAISALVERGAVHLPKFAPYLEDFVSECGAFPTGAHDDQVDAMTQALNRLIHINATKEVVPEKVTYVRWTDDQISDYESANDDLKQQLIQMWGYPENLDE